MPTPSIIDPTLVVNCGSSSIKYALISADNNHRITGLAENLGLNDARIIHKGLDGEKTELSIPDADHKTALTEILTMLEQFKPIAVGHRVVHGGREFSNAVKLDPHTLDEVKRLATLAPLHNPPNAAGIEAVQAIYPDLPQVVVFDTAFHQTMPPKAYRYAIPKELYNTNYIRRYGFHGSSHAYVSNRANQLKSLKSDADSANYKGNSNDNYGWITAHLGNGCSVAAIYANESLDTSMGLTPMEGLMMGTRSGDVDPGLHIHLQRILGLSLEDIDTLLNKKSGLLGVSGISNDMRAVEAVAEDSDHPDQNDAILALEMFAYSAAKHIASLTCALPTLTGIIFTGGIGENAVDMRRKIIKNLRQFNFAIDEDQNAALMRGAEGSFHAQDSQYELWVIPTDEEYQIAQETREVLGL